MNINYFIVAYLCDHRYLLFVFYNSIDSHSSIGSVNLNETFFHLLYLRAIDETTEECHGFVDLRRIRCEK